MKSSTLFLSILTVAALSVSTIVQAEDLPDIKAGLWEVETRTDGESAGVSKQCMDKSVLKRMLSVGAEVTGGACSGVSIEKKGNSYVSKVNCNMGPIKMVSDSVMKGDFSKEYTTESHITMEPAMMGSGKTETVSKARYLGPCGSDMKPGDVVGPNGEKMNMIELMDKAKEMPDMGSMMGELMQGMGQ